MPILFQVQIFFTCPMPIADISIRYLITKSSRQARKTNNFAEMPDFYYLKRPVSSSSIEIPKDFVFIQSFAEI